MASSSRSAGTACVVDDDLRIGKGPREVERIAELTRIDHHVEREIEFLKQAEAPPPGRIPHQVRALVEGPGGVLVPAQDLTDAAHVGVCAVGLQHRFGIRLFEQGVGDDAVRETVLIGDALKPAGLGHRVLVKTRLDVDRLDQPDVGHVRQIVGEQVVADERRSAAEHHLARAVGEPRIAARSQVPEMMVSVDDRAVVEAAHGLLRSFFRRAPMAAYGRRQVKTRAACA